MIAFEVLLAVIEDCQDSAMVCWVAADLINHNWRIRAHAVSIGVCKAFETCIYKIYNAYTSLGALQCPIEGLTSE